MCLEYFRISEVIDSKTSLMKLNIYDCVNTILYTETTSILIPEVILICICIYWCRIIHVHIYFKIVENIYLSLYFVINYAFLQNINFYFISFILLF